MPEKLRPFPAANLSEAQLVRALEVRSDFKNLAVILEYSLDGKTYQGLYRPQKYVRFTPDDRVPVPQELSRDVAYSQLDRQLNWHVSLPVVPWSIKEGDQGVLRPYLPDAKTQQHYYYENQANLASDYYWLQVAILDYLAAVVDRNAGDILFNQHDRHVIDSGLSFVSGEDFEVDRSLIRDAVKGTRIPFSLLRAVELLGETNLESLFKETLPEEAVYWLRQRIQKTLETETIL